MIRFSATTSASEAQTARRMGKTVLAETVYKTCGIAQKISPNQVVMAEGAVKRADVVKFYYFDSPKDALAFLAEKAKG